MRPKLLVLGRRDVVGDTTEEKLIPEVRPNLCVAIRTKPGNTTDIVQETLAVEGTRYLFSRRSGGWISLARRLDCTHRVHRLDPNLKFCQSD